jgi:hypothetical protein
LLTNRKQNEAELVIAKGEKAERADELIIANIKKAERAIANKELKTEEKEKRAEELALQYKKSRTCSELIIAIKNLSFKTGKKKNVQMS